MEKKLTVQVKAYDMLEENFEEEMIEMQAKIEEQTDK